MKKLLIIGIIGAVALVAIAKKTNVCSYASTFVSSVGADVKNQVPTKFELERIRNEVAALEGDISQMARPIAEYKVAIDKTRADIAATKKNIATKKAETLAIVKELEAGKTDFEFDHVKYTVVQVRRQVEKNAEALKRLEKHVKTQQLVLEAKEQSLRATQEQLAKVIAMKHEFQAELARLEADEETLAIAKIGSSVQIDTSRATLIKDGLANIEHRQKVEREAALIVNGDLVEIPLNNRTNSDPVDLKSVRSYLEGNEPAADKTASNK